MKNAILYADKNVLKVYQDIRIDSQTHGDEASILWNLSGMLLEFRKDLGLDNDGLSQKTILDIIYTQEEVSTILSTRHQ